MTIIIPKIRCDHVLVTTFYGSKIAAISENTNFREAKIMGFILSC
jgi:hypothetical protein